MRTLSMTLFVATLLVSLTGCWNHDSDSNLGPFNTDCMPLSYSTTGFGNISFDRDGDLLIVAGAEGNVSMVDRNTCELTPITNIGDISLSVIDYVDTDKLYVGGDSGIYEVDRSTGDYNLAVSSPYINGMVIAPDGYGSYGGNIIYASYQSIYAYDPITDNPPTLIVNFGTEASDLVFGEDGTLYVTLYYQGKIVTVGSDGTVTDFVTGLALTDGLTIDTTNSMMYTAASGSNKLYSIDLSSKVVTALFDVDLDWGFYPSGIVYDGYGTLIIKAGKYPDGGSIKAFDLP